MADSISARYDRLRLTFTYRHGYGGLTPFFDGLREGRCIGAECPECNRRWFPPRGQCPSDLSVTSTVELSGRGVVVALTTGPSTLPMSDVREQTTWALITLDQTVNALVARVTCGDLEPFPGAPVIIAAPREDITHPSQLAHFRLLESTT